MVTPEELTALDREILYALADDAEPIALVLRSAMPDIQDRATGLSELLGRARVLSKFGLVRFRWLEGMDFRADAVPITEDEFWSMPDLDPDGSARSVAGLWIELTGRGELIVTELLGAR